MCTVYLDALKKSLLLLNLDVSDVILIMLPIKMVVYEAARAMVNLKNVTAREVQPAVSGRCYTLLPPLRGFNTCSPYRGGVLISGVVLHTFLCSWDHA